MVNYARRKRDSEKSSEGQGESLSGVSQPGLELNCDSLINGAPKLTVWTYGALFLETIIAATSPGVPEMNVYRSVYF